MKFSAILSKTTTDKIKSKLVSPELGELTFDVYMTPQKFGELVSKYYESEFIIEIHDKD